MSQIAQGVVELITEKPAGRGTAYNIKLNTGDWYGNGFKKPNCSKGDFIKFQWDANGNFKNIVQDSIQIVQQEAPKVQTGVSSGTDWDAKDRRITYLACRKDAIEIMKVAIEQQAIKLPAKDKLQNLVNVVRELSGELFYNVYGVQYETQTQEPDATEAVPAYSGEE